MEVKINGVYRHFKGGFYIVENIAKDSETLEKVVVYRALYGNNDLFVRKYDNFIEVIDKTKYPKANQKYRFELCDF